MPERLFEAAGGRLGDVLVEPAAALVVGQAGVVRQRIEALACQIFGALLHPLARQAIHNAGLAGVLAADKTQ